MMAARTTTLQLALRAAAAGRLECVWLYLPHNGTLFPDTVCLLVDSADEDPGAVAHGMGFPVEGLDTQALEDTAVCARALRNPPSDELLVESFAYYLRHDAWLPCPGAPEPGPWEETKLLMDREFYDALGPERANVPCRTIGCSRGAIALGVLCRPHHFEMLKHEICPFNN